MKKIQVPITESLRSIAAAAVLSLTAFASLGASSDVRAEIAVFAGGCFWCTESDFDKIDGVTRTTSGYIGGEVESPGYRAVSAGTTGHTEGVEIEFDPNVVSYEKLLEVYWYSIDPTVDDRQFCDKGSQYRPEIFVYSAEQRAQAEASKKKITATKPFAEPIKVAITDGTKFWPAEEYHQDYYKKNPLRYKFYRTSCGRDARLEEIWGAARS